MLRWGFLLFLKLFYAYKLSNKIFKYIVSIFNI
jgi:hypothetical protein